MFVSPYLITVDDHLTNENTMKHQIKIFSMSLLLLFSYMPNANARETRVNIDDWNIVYPPNNEVSIIIHDTDDVGLNVNLVFWRGKLPADTIVYDARSERLKVYYSITDFSNVLELLNTMRPLSFVYRTDTGFGEAAYIVSL